MRWVVLATLILSFRMAARPDGGGAAFESVTEYRQDAIDYDSAEKKFFRERFSVLMSQKSSFAFSYLHTEKDGDGRHTWSLVLGDCVPSAEIIVGDYFTNFGAGLVIGKKAYSDPDPFSSGITVSNEKTFLPCTTGNPNFCFEGIAAAWRINFSGLIFSVNPCMSARKRYVNDEDAAAGKTPASLSTLLCKTEKNHTAGEPAEITDGGVMIGLSAGSRFRSEIYVFHTGVNVLSDKSLLLDYRSGYDTFYGEKNYTSYGLYLGYTDRALKLFLEYGLPLRTLRTGQGTTQAGDSAVLYGLMYRVSAFCLSLSGKNSGSGFYSPYSAGYSGAENTLTLYGHARFAEKFLIGGAVTGQNKQYGDTLNSSAHARKEKIFMAYEFSDTERIIIALKRLEEDSGGVMSERVQYRALCRKKITEALRFFLKGAAQDSDRDRISWMAGLGLSAVVRNVVTVVCGFERYEISGKNRIYAKSAGLPDTVSPGCFIAETTNILSAKISLRHRGRNILYAGYSFSKTAEKNALQKIELFGKMVF